MRTKSLCLAAAAVIGGLLTASAQSNVYSLNIVGYVNTVMKGNGAYTLVANPLDDGNGNQLTNLVNALPNKSQVLTWSGSGYVGASKGGGVWGTNLTLAPGTGFFVKNGISGSPDVTNTFVGNVVLLPGGSTNIAVPAGYSLVGTLAPVGGDLTTDANINIGSTLPNKSQILKWDTTGQSYQGTSKGGGVWSTNLTVNVGEGFFIKAQTGTNWVQSLP